MLKKWMIICSENIKTYDSHRLLLNLTNKIDVQRCEKCLTLSNLSIYYTWKNIKKVIQE